MFSEALQPKRSSKRSLDATSATAAGSSACPSSAGQHGAAYAAAMTSYFKAVRQLYVKVQRDHEWKTLENPYGFAPALESADMLRHLLSPLRPPHVLDAWTPYQITLFELGLAEFGKQFHSIQQLIPDKSTRDVVLFYYMWKKCGLAKSAWAEKDAARDYFGLKRMKQERETHGIVPTAYDLMSDEDDSTTLAVKRMLHMLDTDRSTSLTLGTSLLTQQRQKRATSVPPPPTSTNPNLDKMTAWRSDMTAFFTATRALYAAVPPHGGDGGDLTITFGLRTPTTHATLPLLSMLRPPHILDTWSPWELGVFECGLEVYGKRFHLVAALLPRKATSDVVALYYIWKVYSREIHCDMKRAWPASLFA
ncbi:Aste57867_14371 [Aphanomyces stellatus]|uniref:Aste57867_14371 protein n=1 Tax=Aphanomyces stellatus TaxID=120398 RepID=A0A485L1K2_9STRA|nr:hypothetical protein As57867_014317 [Aphanomyces stellatus]VFT91194.1 Aste57867_14371 [Aphanomyces stellatus]